MAVADTGAKFGKKVVLVGDVDWTSVERAPKGNCTSLGKGA